MKSTAIPTDGAADGDFRMTTLAKLLAEKQRLIERLEQNPGEQEREEIGRQLEKIDTALNLLDEAGPDNRKSGKYYPNPALSSDRCAPCVARLETAIACSTSSSSCRAASA